jgi:hypothetical protein
MFWQYRDSRDRKGEGNPIPFSEEKAERACRFHNHLYPHIKHWWEAVEFREEAHFHLLYQPVEA